jgi:hypothetical protein
MSLIKITHPRASETSIRVWTDKTCKFCREAMEEVEGKEIEAGKVFLLRPDFNSAGVLTHFHVEVEDDPLDSPNNNRERVQKARQEREERRRQIEAITPIASVGDSGLGALFDNDEPAQPKTRAEIVAHKMHKKEV